MWWMAAIAVAQGIQQAHAAEASGRSQNLAAMARIRALREHQRHLQLRANSVVERGMYAASLRRLQANQFIGRQEAEIGASGVGGRSADLLVAASETGRDMDFLEMQKAARDEAEALRHQSSMLGREVESIYQGAEAVRDNFGNQIMGIALGTAGRAMSAYRPSTKAVDTTTSSMSDGLRAIPESTPPPTTMFHPGRAGMTNPL